MPAQKLRLSDRQLKGVKTAPKDYFLTDDNGLVLRVFSNGSLLWNFNYLKTDCFGQFKRKAA